VRSGVGLQYLHGVEVLPEGGDAKPRLVHDLAGLYAGALDRVHEVDGHVADVEVQPAVGAEGSTAGLTVEALGVAMQLAV
jgi:hypothetical protein